MYRESRVDFGDAHYADRCGVLFVFENRGSTLPKERGARNLLTRERYNGKQRHDNRYREISFQLISNQAPACFIGDTFY